MNIARSLSLFALPVLLIACGEAAESAPDTAQPEAPATEAPAPAEKAMDPARETAEAPAEAGPTTSITFAENSHDFGTIDEGDVVTHVFTFTNTATTPSFSTAVRGPAGARCPSAPRSDRARSHG